jgi:hypothetical protein
MLHSGKKLRFEKKQRAIIKKICRVELSFLCTALFLYMIYPPMKFIKLIPQILFEICSGQNCDGRTAGQIPILYPRRLFGGG